MTRKEITVTITTGFLAGIAGVVLTLTATASTIGEKVATQKEALTLMRASISAKADAATIANLVTRDDIRSLVDAVAANARLQERRDTEQDRRIDTLEKVSADQGKLLTSVDKKVDIVIAILKAGERRSE